MRLPEGVESCRAFSKRIGRSHVTVGDAIRDGRIPESCVYRHPITGAVAGVYWQAAQAAFANNTDPTQAERAGAAPINTLSTSSDPAQAAMPPAAGGYGDDLFKQSGGEQSAETPAAPIERGGKDEHGYLGHRARTEEYRSLQAELEYLERVGAVVSVVDVREAIFRRTRTLRDRLLNIPDRVATILAAERDPSRVHLQLTEEIKRVLSELSNDATAEAAEGAGERVAA